MTTATRFLIPIFRPSKLEAVKAMNALVERGFTVETKLTEVKSTLEYRGNYNYRRGKYGSKGSHIVKGITADWKGREGMDKLEVIKLEFEWGKSHLKEGLKNLDDDDIYWLISEVETLRLDNTYLQQRLKRELEK